MAISLSSHPEFPSESVSAVRVDLECRPSGLLRLRYIVTGKIAALVLPESVEPDRTDNLWKSTCFEVFIGRMGQPDYLEINLAPSSQWAAYAFSDYRAGMRDALLAGSPQIEAQSSDEMFELTAEIDLGGQAVLASGNSDVALAAVIEEKDGRKSLWALDHPSGNPDFHNRACFLHKIKAAESR